MHPDTLAALRLLGLALATHPEDVAELAAYGDLPAHVADAIEDWIEGTDEDDEEDDE